MMNRADKIAQAGMSIAAIGCGMYAFVAFIGVVIVMAALIFGG